MSFEKLKFASMKNIAIVLIFLAVSSTATQLGQPRDCSGNDTFSCKDGRCIPATWRCDGDIDCKGEEDELNCPTECAKNEHKCGMMGKDSRGSMRLRCIPQQWKCDGEVDCEDHSDEIGCTDVKCGADQFMCDEFDGGISLCIPKTWKCDGQRDCASGIDEQNCENRTCAATDFRCSNGICIFKSWACDGEDDCGDNSDEQVGMPSMCNETKTLCDQTDMWKCRSGDCIPKRWRCDGEADCLDHSDEKNCSVVAHTCNIKEEFACASSRHCINKLWTCDGEEDCPDGSDEANCADAKTSCVEGEWTCPTVYGAFGTDPAHVYCIPLSSRCDGNEDCPDGADEIRCNNTKSDECVEHLEYKCPTTPTLCINYTDLCTKPNYDCGEKEQAICSNSKLLQFCNPKSDGCKCHKSFVKNVNVCHCGEGWKLGSDGKCEDIDECAQPGTCDQICHNTPGSFVCSCHAGYKLSHDSHHSRAVPTRCRAMGGDPLVLLSNRATIRQFDLVTNVHFPLITSPGSAVAMDFHLTNGTLVWSDITQKEILMCKIGNESGPHHMITNQKCDEGNRYKLVHDEISTPDGLAIDWIHDLLFWTDGGLDRVNVLNLQTGKRRVLFESELEEPRAIAVDPEMGLVFWTDWGKEARIERAGMDGQHRIVIVKGDRVKWPNGLALDYVDKRVYWADAKIKSIFSCDYYGNGIKTVLHSHEYLRHPFSLAVFEDRIYYTDWEHDGVITVNKFTGGDVRKVMDKVASPMTVRIYHKQAQPLMENKCIDHICNDLCLPTAVIRESSPKDELTKPHRPYSCACSGTTATDVLECVVDSASSETGFSLFSMFLILIAIVAIVGSAVYYRRRIVPGTFTALNFDNPIYRRTTHDQEMEDPFRDPFADPRGGGSVAADQLPRLVVGDEDPERNIQNPNNTIA